jgi:hypothetical protein
MATHWAAMSDQETPSGVGDLQFDRVVTESTSAVPDAVAATCAACHTSLETEYYDVNGQVCCSSCRTTIESAAETPRGVTPLLIAGAFGLGAGIVGAIIYYAVIAIANLEIGIVAILIGYMVGYAVRRGARGRGGLRFQILAVVLTYASIALAYTPIAVKQAISTNRQAEQAPTTSGNVGEAPRPAPGAGGVLVGLLFLCAFIAALPVIVVIGSFPSGLISAFIMFIGMSQAWKMTGAPFVQVLGPYRVGAARPSTPA